MDRITFAGDSITAWNPRKDVINLGIPGDTTRDILWRIEEIKANSEGIIYIMVGINDILMGISEEKSVLYYEKILLELYRTHIKAAVISILPVAGDEMKNKKIRFLNESLEEMCVFKGCKYIDIHSEMTGERGELNHRYTTDGIHLSARGYEVLNRVFNIKK